MWMTKRQPDGVRKKKFVTKAAPPGLVSLPTVRSSRSRNDSSPNCTLSGTMVIPNSAASAGGRSDVESVTIRSKLGFPPEMPLADECSVVAVGLDQRRDRGLVCWKTLVAIAASQRLV